MLSVGYRITFGDAVYSSGGATRLVALSAEASLRVPVNACRLVLAPPDGLAVTAGDRVQVELGARGEETVVFTGTAAAVERGVRHLAVEAASSFSRLIAARVNLFYEKPKAGDVVHDLAARFELDAGAVADGLELPFYVLGAERSAYEQMLGLARRCGFDLYADAEDRLAFTPHEPAATHDCTYGVHLLAHEREARPAPISGVEVYGESPASHGQGLEAASWLTQKEVKGTAGDDSGRVARLSDPAARTVEIAGRIAAAVLAAAGRGERGRASVLGNPRLRLGDAVRFAELPDGAANGTFKVSGVRHVLDARRGFVTHIDWEQA